MAARGLRVLESLLGKDAESAAQVPFNDQLFDQLFNMELGELALTFQDGQPALDPAFMGL